MKVHPPGPSEQFSLLDRNGDEIPQFEMLDRLHDEYGDVFQYATVAGALYVFVHPDSVRTVFRRREITRTPLLSLALGEGVLAADNEHWKRQRKLMLPTFRRPKVAAFTSLIAETTKSHSQRWEAQAATGRPVDIVDAMSRLTLSVVSRAMFSVDLEQNTNSFLDAYSVAIDHLGSLANATSFNATMLLSPKTNQGFQQALETMDAVVYSIIRDRRRSGSRPDDLLTVLLNAMDAETGCALTEIQIRDEVITMLLAGHETTSLVLTWAWYLLGRHPEAEDRLRTEIDDVLQGRTIEYADFDDLPYSRMVIDETMRLYPPVAAIYRQTESDVEIAGYTVSSGTGIVVSPYMTHRHLEFWQDPLAFNPDRFDPKIARKRRAYSYFPFGAGRHTCLGKHFAIIEAQTILITVLQHYRLRLLDTVAAVPHLTLTLRPRQGLQGLLEPYSFGEAQ